jgi:hypothetical protein
LRETNPTSKDEYFIENKVVMPLNHFIASSDLFYEMEGSKSQAMTWDTTPKVNGSNLVNLKIVFHVGRVLMSLSKFQVFHPIYDPSFLSNKLIPTNLFLFYFYCISCKHDF